MRGRVRLVGVLTGWDRVRIGSRIGIADTGSSPGWLPLGLDGAYIRRFVPAGGRLGS